MFFSAAGAAAGQGAQRYGGISWSQSGPQNCPKMVPKLPQDGPKTAPRGPQEGFKNNKNTKTRHVGPQEAKTPKSPHLLGPKLDPKLTHFGLILVTFCQHVYEDVSSSIFDGFWEASEPSFFDSR